ncbi:MAG: GTP pyrophosphokinase, partial [Desulfobacterales bacterium]
SKTINHNNYQERIGDIVGIRIVCLRLSDIIKVEAYLKLLVEEKILRFIQKPDHKRSFVLPIDPGEGAPQDLDLKYSGYSSIHYQIKLGENSDVKESFKRIQVELQLRTILEEAWGEIDHKYRYVHSRIGEKIPEHIHSGFYNLSAYLQTAAMQAEHLCREVEAHRSTMPLNSKGKKKAPTATEHSVKKAPDDGVDQLIMPPALQAVLEAAFGFKPTERTLAYILKRFNKVGYSKRSKSSFEKMFRMKRLQDFRKNYQEILNRDPFKDNLNRNIDAINAVNFVLFNEIEGAKVAKEGLRSTLKWRKDRSSL